MAFFRSKLIERLRRRTLVDGSTVDDVVDDVLGELGRVVCGGEVAPLLVSGSRPSGSLMSGILSKLHRKAKLFFGLSCSPKLERSPVKICRCLDFRGPSLAPGGDLRILLLVHESQALHLSINDITCTSLHQSPARPAWFLVQAHFLSA